MEIQKIAAKQDPMEETAGKTKKGNARAYEKELGRDCNGHDHLHTDSEGMGGGKEDEMVATSKNHHLGRPGSNIQNQRRHQQ